ncbi:uncharacterized protein BO97DRAFT_401087 [Aspergillus homomorphus CBS 101889]|uniref:Zn(2)-C6 fungal-type domain-containing protein n=1 Tax=Aspergillus homomorphus (strain CBS 101889) TaxID=1450537 RepID=A0A395HKV4_ASPHC|nr:hypothetical protein BO97DRAFT_401087 [Aspergillus homomorphus CBS 101889]RAL06904.1 hypothetical protein BO97DRAFT_401087 [Aspergillus homomorphus CBS 101889]
MNSSCYTCRRRHVECQMVRPPCKKCEKAGLECLLKRPLRWVEGATFRGTATNSPIESAFQVRPSTPRHVGSKSPDKSLHETDLVDYSSEITTSKGISWHVGIYEGFLRTPFNLDDPTLKGLDEGSRYYLNYYSRCVCKLFVMFDSQHNPLRQLIPAAIAHPVLLTSVVALAARHRANATQTFEQIQAADHPRVSKPCYDAALYKYRAIKGLSQALNDGTGSSLDVVISSAFLLIFLDLFESGSDKWNVHVEGVKKLIAALQVPTMSRDLGTTMEGMRDFAMQQIYLIDTLGTTFTRPGLLVNPGSHQPSTSLQMSVDKAYLGCPEQFVGALRSFSAARDCLAKPGRLDRVDAYLLLQTMKDSLESTQSFNCHAWAAGLEPSRSSLIQPTQSIQMLKDLGQAYKSGTLIYGWRVCDVFTGDSTPLDDIVDELISTVAALRSNEALFKCILWPLFVAGLESRHPCQRQLVGDCLRRFWFETKCINVINAEKILQRFWAQPEQGPSLGPNWIFSMGHIEGDWLLI